MTTTTTTESAVPIDELAAEMGVDEELALALARRAGAKRFGRSWKGTTLVPMAIAEKTLTARREEIEQADRRRHEYAAEHRVWAQAAAEERRRVFAEEARNASADELAAASAGYGYLGISTIGIATVAPSARAAQVAAERVAEHMRTWTAKNPEPQP